MTATPTEREWHLVHGQQHLGIYPESTVLTMVHGGTPVRPDDVDLRWVPAMLYRNETVEESGVSGAVLNHPALGVAWLANKLAQHGDTLEAGDLVLAGSFTRPMWVHPGDTVLADFHDLGTITCRFS